MQSRFAPLKGRAALGNPAGRFERQQREPVDDGWYADCADAPRVVQEVLPEQARTIIARNSSPDVPFSQSVNPYRGCEHGCIYCYARPSHAYIDLSPGLDFERRLRFKANAAEVLTHLAEQREPLVITQNGEAKAVLQDVASFEETQETLALLKVLALGQQDVEAGRLKPVADVVARLRAKRAAA